MRLAPDRFCSAVYVWCVKRIHTEEDRAQFDFRLNDPPPTLKVTPSVMAAEMAGFAAFAGAFGVKGPGAR